MVVTCNFNPTVHFDFFIRIITAFDVSVDVCNFGLKQTNLELVSMLILDFISLTISDKEELKCEGNDLLLIDHIRRVLTPCLVFLLYPDSVQDSHFRHIQPSPHASATSRHESDGFKWHSANLGTIISRPHETIMDLNVQGFRFKSRMCNEVLTLYLVYVSLN